MTKIVLLIVVMAVLVCLWIFYRRGASNILYPSSVLLLFSITDVMLPAIIWLIFGQQNNLPWLNPLTPEQLAKGLIFYFGYYLVFILALVSGEKGGNKIPERGYGARIEGRLILVTSVVFSLHFLNLADEIAKFGGFFDYALAKAGAINEIRSSGRADTSRSVLNTIPLGTVFLCLSGAGFYFRVEFKRRWLFTYIFPAVALIFAVLTFYRGSILNFMFVFLFIEYIRLKSDKSIGFSQTQNKVSARKLILIGLLVLTIFTAYGSIRNGIRSFSQTQTESQINILPGFVKNGFGLLSVTHIVSEFGVTTDYLMGKTYFDMLLLPVPRFVYTSKPIWYGIDDVTKALGWPDSTQSAVTMPGEAYANFGVFGLVIAIPFAFIFIFLLKTIKRKSLAYILIGPVVIFMVPTMVNWMSFTGMVNLVQLLVILWVITFIFPGGKKLI